MSAELMYAIQDARDAAESAVGAYPADDQLFMAMEEMGELAQAISHHRRGRHSEPSSALRVVDECADVIIMTLQMALMHGTDAELADALDMKVYRLNQRIAEKGASNA